jgi:hypothetical protein
MSDDLIKRSDVLFMIDVFERDFEQSWRVQFRANIYAIPAVKDDRIEKLERENAEIDQPFFNLYAKAFTRIKAVVDGKSDQSIKAIVYELLDAFSAMGVKE